MQKVEEKSLNVPMLRCSVCGRGHVPLSDKLMEVLLILREKPMSVLEVFQTMRARKSEIGRTAVNNRISALCAHRLIVSHKKSKAWIYRPKE